MAVRESFDLGLGRNDKKKPVRGRLEELAGGAPLTGEPPKTPTINDISRETGVPWNVIEVVADEAQIPDEQRVAFAQDFAARMKDQMERGQDVPDAMRSIFGEDAPIDNALERAVQLASNNGSQQGGDGEGSFVGDFGRSVAAGAATGVGAIAEGVGTLLDVDDLFGDPGITDFAENAGQAVAQTLQGWGKDVRDGMSDEGRRAIRNSTPSGKLFEPDTWEFEGDVSAQGIALLTADVLGSLAPVVIAGVFGGPGAAAAVGGAQGAGAGAQTGREIVDRASHEQLADQSAYYNEMIAKGLTPDQAKEKVADAAGSLSAVFAAPVAGVGGAITGRLVRGGVAGLAGRGVGARVGGTAAIGAVEEGVQEVGEGIAARSGAAIGSGLDVDRMEGTFGEFVLGALGGGAIGGARGAIPPGRTEEEEDEPRLEMPPAVDAAAPTGESLAQPDAPAPAMEQAPDRASLGPVARAAQAAGPAPEQPAPMAPGAQPGQTVTVTLGDGQPVNAEFVSEGPEGVNLTIDGEPLLISPERAAEDGITITPRDPLVETAFDAEATDPTSTNFSPLDDTAEPPEQRATRLRTALDDYLSEQKIDATPEDRLSITNSIDAYGGTIEQAVADWAWERQLDQTAYQPPEGTEPPVPEVPTQPDIEPATAAPREQPTPEAAPPADGAQVVDSRETAPEAEQITNETQPRPILPIPATETGLATQEQPAPTEPDPGTMAATWANMDPDARADALTAVGFRGRDGALNAPGRRAAAKEWDALTERVREKLGEQMAAPAPDAPATAPAAQPGQTPRRIGQSGRADLVGQRPDAQPQEPSARPPRQQPGTNVLPEGEEAITPPAPEGESENIGDLVPGPKPGSERDIGDGITIRRRPDGGVTAFYRGFAFYESVNPSSNSRTAARFRQKMDEARRDPGGLDAAVAPAFERELRYQAANTTLPDGWQIDASGQRAKLRSPDGKVQRDTMLTFDGGPEAIATEMAMMKSRAEQDAEGQASADPQAPETSGAVSPENGQQSDQSDQSSAPTTVGQPGTTGRKEKIEDFGEKIGGARKDKARKWTDDLDVDLDPGTMPLSQAFPKPDLEALIAAGNTKETVAAVAAIRGAIPRKPTRGYRRRRWAEDVIAARVLAKSLLDGEIQLSEIDAGTHRMGRSGRALTAMIQALGQLPVDMMDEVASGYEVEPVLGMERDDNGERSVRYFAFREQGKYRHIVDKETIEQLVPEIESHIRHKREQKSGGSGGGAQRTPVKLATYKSGTRGDHFIGFKGKGVVRLVGGFKGYSEARAYLSEHQDSLQQQAENLRDGLNERGGENRDRKGMAHREGDVTPEMFEQAFGFRGVEFGNWNNQAERQRNLNRAYDALMDLAGVLGIPSRAISLNGTLGIAFGARGRGGKNPAAAHYEPSYKVMNLTKKNGAGSLAHEWFHAFDHFLAEQDAAQNGGRPANLTGLTAAVRDEFMSDRATRGRSGEAFAGLGLALAREHEWFKRSQEADRARSKPYFATTIELAARGFEKFVIDELARRGMLNDYLANIDAMSGAYPSTREMKRDAIRDGFVPFLDAGVEMLGVQEGVTPQLPAPNDNLLYDGPDTGETWDAPEGRYKIVGREGGTYTVLTPGGATEIYEGAAAVEAMIEAADQAKADADAERDADAAEQRRKDEELAARTPEILERYVADRGKPTTFLSKTYRWPSGVFSRAEMAVRLVEEGWRVSGTGSQRNLRGPKGSAYGPGTWTREGLDFAQWYAATIEAQQQIEPAPEPDPAPDESPDTAPAPGDLSSQISDAISQAIDEEFGNGPVSGTSGETDTGATSAPESQQPAGPTDMRTSGEAARDAAKNVGQGADAAIDGLMKLFGGKDTLNSGFTFSEETYQAAKPLFKEAISKFADAGADILQMARALVRELSQRGMSAEQVTEMTPYLQRFIEEEQAGAAVAGETEAEQGGAAEQTGDTTPTDEYAAFREAVATAMRDGEGFGNIRTLRKLAATTLGRPVDEAEHKAIEEAAEEAIVGVSREIAQGDGTAAEKYDRLVDLYARQPIFDQKNSTSVSNQAYSTPAPLAFLASRLGGITPQTRVTEPSGGTGMLVIEATPSLVRANEKNPERVAALRRQLPGAEITEGDATEVDYAPYDVLITNPPFGQVKEGGEPKTWPMARTRTREIDHAIAWRALKAMPEDGSAVLILGGVNPVKYTGDNRTKGYQGNGKRQFYAALYRDFNVVDHFTVDGDLYKRQGAGWPVDVIVVRGKGQTSLPLPMAEAPPIFNSWSDLKGKLDDADTLGPTERQPGVRDPGSSEGAGARTDVSGLQGSPDREGGSGDPQPRPGGSAGTGGAAGGSSSQPEGGRGGARGDDGTAGRPDDATNPGSTGEPGTGGVSQGGNSDGRSDGAARGDVAARENTEAETDLQVRYGPRSQAQFAVGTLVPRNMQNAITTALEDIEARHGSVDQFVADALGYTLDELLGTPTSKGAFSAEQVDALAMAIDNVDKGRGFIIGDQTGVGKGRVVAGMLRFAERKGRVPVFVTKSPGLYGDMLRDLRDIGESEAHKGVLMTNRGLRGDKAVPISAKKGDALTSLANKGLNEAIAHMTGTGTLPDGYRYLFTTYSQMQTVSGRETERRPALRAIAPNAMFVFDESHEAGGGSNEGWKKKNAPDDRAAFIRTLVQQANGTVFSSATYAKNPEVMSLYSTTNLADAVSSPDQLGEAISRGGVPLQQVAAATLTADGQYVRRERSWDGVEMNLDPVPVNKSVAETTTQVIRNIFDADVRILQGARKEAIKRLKEQGYADLPNGRAVDVASADQTGFSSVLHNVVSQFLLAIKVDEIAKRAIAAHEAGEKPVIAVVNTNGALLQSVVEDEELSVGAPVTMPFDTILHRYVDRLRRITVKDDSDQTHRIDLPDSALGSTAVAALNRLHDQIRRTDLSALTAAPLDKLKDALRTGGLNVGEITGRSRVIENGKLAARDSSEAAKKKQMLAFNSGELDALLINQAGSTGYSLHALAGTDGNDGKQRRMIVLQPDPNIDTFMQMLGRIHRTGQTSLPKYEIAVSDLAVEKRVAAVLMKKMASLSANTTANKESAVSLNVTDFLNEVGDKVVESYLTENWDIASALQLDPTAEDIATKLTGRLAIMAPDVTQRVYDDLEVLYNDEIERLTAIGENPLTAQVVDWQATPVASNVVKEGGGRSGFDVDTVVEVLSVRRLGKPHPYETVEEMVTEADGDVEAALAKLDEMLPVAREDAQARVERLAEAERAAFENRENAPAAYTKAQAATRRARESVAELEAEANNLRARLREFRPGAHFTLTLGETEMPAVAISIDAERVEGNPLALSKYRLRFAVADAMKEVGIPLSKLGPGDTQIAYERASPAMVKAAFENGASASRETKQVVTGNLINAFATFGRGQVVQFTMEDGTQRYGVALPGNFDAGEHLQNQPVEFADADQVIRFLSGPAEAIVKDANARLTIARNDRGGFKLTAKRGARELFSGDTIMGITGEWSTRGTGPLSKTVTEQQLRDVLAFYQSELGLTLQTDVMRDLARSITGERQVEFDRGDAEGQRQKRAAPPPEPRADGQPTPDTMRGIKAALDAEIERLGLTGKVKVSAWRSLRSGPFKLEGFYEAGEIGISASDGNPIETMHHEIIHALRDPALWGGEKGIFTDAEWRSLVRAARADKALMDQARRDYADKPSSIQTEEAVAEMYRRWRARRDTGPLAALFQRIADVLEAVGNALRGNGFQAAGDVFRRIASGEIGGRGPGGGGRLRDARGRFASRQTTAQDDATGEMFPVEPLFHSPAVRAVRAAKQAKAPAKDWKAIIAKLPGVKKAEIEWLGIDEWLDMQEGQVTREQVMDFLESSMIEIVENVQGQRPDDFDEIFGQFRRDEAFEMWSDAEIEEQVLSEAEREGFYEPAAFLEYTEEGGTNYREILLRVPGLERSGRNAPPSDAEIIDALASGNIAGKRPFVNAGHFEQENIVVHARVKDRQGPNGEKILFIEEIQSDLASTWRDNSESPEVTARRQELQRQLLAAETENARVADKAATVIFKEQPDFQPSNKEHVAIHVISTMAADVLDVQRTNPFSSGPARFSSAAAGEAFRILREFDGELYDQVIEASKAEHEARERVLLLGTEKSIEPGTPETPFADPNQYALMVKRLLRLAADEGHDRVSWTPGYMQAERWNQTAQNVVDTVRWEPYPDGGDAARRVVLGLGRAENIVTVSPAGIVSGAGPVNGKTLTQLLGPSLAKQIMTEDSGDVSGERVAFADSGYAIAYDQHIRKAVEKLTKKHGARPYKDSSLPDMQPDFRFMARDGASVVWSVDMTPDLRAAARQSQPMFKRVASQPAANPRVAGRVVSTAKNLRAGVSQIASDAITNGMKDRGGYNTLAFVPGRALFAELGSGIRAAAEYLTLKERMDTKRNDKHAETDEIAQKWRRLMNRDQDANAKMMQLMHDSTIARVDPSKGYSSPLTARDEKILADGPRGRNKTAYDAAVKRKAQHDRESAAHDELTATYRALPKAFRDLYVEVRDAYARLDREQTEAILRNIERAMTLSVSRAERERDRAIKDAERKYNARAARADAERGLTGTERATKKAQAAAERDQAVKDAKEQFKMTAAQRIWAKDSKVNQMRAQFETNKISGPYFPLARFGEYFTLARDDDGNVASFSRHETVQEQRAAQEDMEAEGYDVEVGVMSETDTRDLVDPAFVADIEAMLSTVNADDKLLDDIWQRWLETLPDMSIRKHRIHRKNRPGYDADALRAFGHHMFHGSHQLARLLYSLDMQDKLEQATEQARETDDPVRNGFIVNEMKRRHAFTMNPKGAWWASRATGLAFVYYLSVSPAAAIVNLSQTSIVGTAVLGRYGGVGKAGAALSKALADLTRSPSLSVTNDTKRLTKAERDAMDEAYRRGTIDRTQSHDLASVAESGVEYDAKWVGVMRKVSWLFHHSERINREVTFLAAYRLLRGQGMAHAEAITEAGNRTWEVHFDYQNTSKPRFMQNPGMQVLMTFRNFTVNFLWRIFRDLHQSVRGKSPEARKEARRQAAAMASMMLFHAGIKGLYGYGLVMTLLGMFFPEDEDDPEERLEKILFDYLPRPVVKAMLDGVPGTLAGIDLTGRIGMPNLWFRPPMRPLEGADLYQHYVNEVLGPIPAIGMNVAIGTQRVVDGAQLRDGTLVWRGVETAMPKAVRDIMKSGRYGYEGALTFNGDPIKDEFSPWEIISQASGFSPKDLIDQYDQNGRLKRKERAIQQRRSNVIKQVAEQIKDGDRPTPRQLRLMNDYNSDYPEWPITWDTIMSSVRGRQQRAERNTGGVSINQRLEPRLRGTLSPLTEP